MPDQDDRDECQLEDRLRRAFRWMAEDAGVSLSVTAGPRGAESARTAAPDREPHDELGLYLDDPMPLTPRRRTRRAAMLSAAAVVILAAAGVSLGIVATSSGSDGSGRGATTRAADSAAKAQVVSALGATTSAGNWDISYSYGEVPGSTACSPSNLRCGLGEGDVPPNLQDESVTGTGIIDVNPKAMVTDAEVSDFGHVVLRIDTTQVWEFTAGDSGGLAPDPGAPQVAGQALSQYATLVEDTLGTREGAAAMLGIASPTGYLELDEQAITGVTPAGTGTVDGQAVTEFHVSVQPAELASDPSASPEEATTIRAAVATLDAAGLSGTTDQVAVDAQGFIIQSITTYGFSDGGSVTVQGDFSNFGCAGSISMPGQSGPTSPPAGCVSPDSPQSTAPTTTPVPATTPTTSPATTIPTTSAPYPASTIPGSTTTPNPTTTNGSTPPTTTKP